MTYQAMGKENLIYETIIEQIKRVEGAKQLVIDWLIRTRKYPDSYTRLFLSHLVCLGDLCVPLLDKGGEVDQFTNLKNKILFTKISTSDYSSFMRDAFSVHDKLMRGLKTIGIWNVYKQIKLGERELASRAVRGSG